MAIVRKAEPGIVFASCLFNPQKFSFERLKSLWTERYSLDGIFWPEFNPSLDYYSKEMGPGLQRAILWDQKPREREELVKGKLWSWDTEQLYASEGKRAVNIDIGMVLKEQMLLATNKPYSHRIYLGQGVWADLTYTYENKSYHFLPWTYPDYRHEEKVKFFNSLRQGLFSK